jgi:putative heme iron utilization protein
MTVAVVRSGSSLAFVATRDHGSPRDAPSAAERARTIAAAANSATLATLTADGDPWASFVAYGLLEGAPVLCVSNLAEHGRNLAGDPRARLSIVAASSDPDPLASSRITLAGAVVRPAAAERDAVAAAYPSAVSNARVYLDFGDFTLWVLRVERVRWVGGYGRMDSVTAEQYRDATPDPITPFASGAIAHLNDDHADDLAAMVPGLRRLSRHRHRGFAPASTATAWTCGCTPRAGWATPGSVSQNGWIRLRNCVRPQPSWLVPRVPADFKCEAAPTSG